jgi:hypothetical protein
VVSDRYQGSVPAVISVISPSPMPARPFLLAWREENANFLGSLAETARPVTARRLSAP